MPFSAVPADRASPQVTSTELTLVNSNVWDAVRHTKSRPDETILALRGVYKHIVFIRFVKLLALVLVYWHTMLSAQVRSLKP